MATAVDTIIANIYNDILQLYNNNKILHFDETDNNHNTLSWAAHTPESAQL